MALAVASLNQRTFIQRFETNEMARPTALLTPPHKTDIKVVTLSNRIKETLLKHLRQCTIQRQEEADTTLCRLPQLNSDLAS